MKSKIKIPPVELVYKNKIFIKGYLNKLTVAEDLVLNARIINFIQPNRWD